MNAAPATTTAEKAVIAGLGQVKTSTDPHEVLTCLGLGSCIGLTAYDPIAKVAGMCHIVLPEDPGRGGPPSPKFANVSVPHVLSEMEKLGATKRHIIVKLAGGAQMSSAPGMTSAFKIGEKNFEATKRVLAELGLRCTATETGGNRGRSLRLYVDSGKVLVSSVGSEPQEL